MADELPATPESPPSPPSDNGDRLDRSPDRLVEAKTKAKRVMSEKQLENLRKGREVKAAKGKAKLEPQAPEPTAPEPPAPEPPAKPKPKPRAKPQPKTQTPQMVMEPANLNFSVF
jgi:hypothetical protein